MDQYRFRTGLNVSEIPTLPILFVLPKKSSLRRIKFSEMYIGIVAINETYVDLRFVKYINAYLIIKDTCPFLIFSTLSMKFN